MWKLITVVTINAKTKVSDCNKNNKSQEQPIYESSESSESNDYSAIYNISITSVQRELKS